MSGWTFETLKEHLQALMAERDQRNQQRFDGQEKAVAAALQAAEKAVQKAETAAEKRFDSVNEFRGQLTDQAATFMPRLEAEQRIGQQAERLAGLESRMERQGGRQEGVGRFGGVLVSIASLLIAAVAVAVAFLK
jgi:hypothetical protein